MATFEPLGHKVVVRRAAGDHRAAGPVRYSDVVGILVQAGPDVLTVRRRNGSVVEIARSDIEVLKPVMAAPRDVLALEEVAAAGWPAPDTRWLGRWLLRAGEGWTGRANSVLPLGDPGLPLDAALAEVTGWYAERGLPARFTVPTPARELLDAALAERGWTAYNPTEVRTADLGVLLRDRAAGPYEVTVTAVPTEEWLALYHYRGGTGVPPVAHRILAAAREPGFLVLRAGGSPVAVARGTVDDGWAGISAVEVAPGRRREGLGTAVMLAVLRWAADRGAERAYLQVAEDNTAGRALYDALGFLRHHGYHYRLAPSPGR